MTRGKPGRASCTEPDCDRVSKARGLCSWHYLRVWRTGSTGDPRETAFWSKVDRDGAGGCWWWTGYVHPDGYGRYGGHAAHRVVYEKLVGPIHDGLVLDHLCRVRHCVNPEHLEPVPQRENLRRGLQGDCWGFVPDVAPSAPRHRVAVCSIDGCVRVPYKRDLCRPHYRRWLADPERTSERLQLLALTPEQRFWSKVDKGSPGECWMWLASRHSQLGYGQWHPERSRNTWAHRHAYVLTFGPVPDGLEVHHVCQVRACVNPAHLQAVTRSENIRQRVARR